MSVGSTEIGGDRIQPFIQSPDQGLVAAEQRRGDQADVHEATPATTKGLTFNQLQEFFMRCDGNAFKLGQHVDDDSPVRRCAACDFHDDMRMA